MKKNTQKEGTVKIVHKKSFIYSMLSGGVLVLAAAIVLIILAASGVFSKKSIPVDVNNGSQSNVSTPTSSGGGDDTDVDTVSYVNPLDKIVVLNEQGFFYNNTLNCYYEHVGIDMTAAAGSNVYAVADGKIESIYSGDILRGTQIIIDHGDGLKSVYGYVEPVGNLKAGDTVKQGQTIGAVAEPTGSEYKDGAHLHLEMYLNEATVDPAEYLTLSEK